jgi:hypothetical protein
VWWARARERIRRRSVDRATSSGIDPHDLAELEQRFAAVSDEQARHRDARLVVQLQRVIERRVPVRRIEAVPSLSAPRIRFADGTAVLVHGEHAGDVGVLASWVHHHSVVASACSADAAGTHLVLAAYGRHRTMSVLVTGLDQPD